MAHLDYLNIEDLIQALRELKGEADWPDILDHITKKRGGNYEPYKDWRNYDTTMFQFVQQHCQGYAKYIGPEYFLKVRINPRRFRLIDYR